jgi:Thioredoxin
MDRVILVLGGLAIAGAVAALLGRRPDPPAANTTHVPRQLDRADFVRIDAPWLVAVFTSATCNSCAAVWQRARRLESDRVAVTEIEIGRDAALHDRYRIDGVPTLVICDSDGAVHRAFLGAVSAEDLSAAITEITDAPSIPPPTSADGTDDGS